MLVLDRDVEQGIEIDGGRIHMKILKVRGNRVWVGFTAPRSIQIHNDEVAENIRQFGSRKGGASRA